MGVYPEKKVTTAKSVQELAQLAGQTVVAAAAADPSGATGHRFARLLGQGDDTKAKLAEQRLARTCEQLTRAAGERSEATRAALEAQWATRLADLLEECPGAGADLRALVKEIRAGLPASAVPPLGDAAIEAEDMPVSAGSGGSAGMLAHRDAKLPAGPGFPADSGHSTLPAAGDEPAIGKVPAGAGVTRRLARLAAPPALLAGRDEPLAELDERLAGGNDPGSRAVTLYGPPGVGKTCLALAYAHRQADEVGLAWQFAADDPVVLAAGFGELAAALGVQDGVNVADSVALLHEVLATFPAEWLLVFDNAPDQASVQAFVPPVGRGRVLITSQSHRWPSGQRLEVPALDPEPAAGFLLERSCDEDWQAAQDLACKLGGLPLALEQAAAYVQATGASLAGYLSSLRQQQGRPAGGETVSVPRAVAETWALAFAQLERSAPNAAALLRLLAFCASAAVPLHLLLEPRPGLTDSLHWRVARVLKQLLGDPRAAADAVAVLSRYSLINPAADELASVHPLVQALTAEQMPADVAAAWRQATAAVIDAAVPTDPQRPDTWAEFAALVPHALAVLPADGLGMERIADYLGCSGSYAASQELWQRVAQARAQVLGADHPDVLNARASLTEWVGRGGDAAGARDQYAALLPIREQVCGPDHPDTLIDRASLAHWTGKAGHPAAARDQYAILLPIRTRADGPDHPDTLDTAAQLARWTGEAGDPAAARDQYAILLPIRTRADGPDHPDTLDTAAQLARWTGEAGDPAAARDQYAVLLPIRSKVYGPEHPGTLSTHANLAYWIGEAGDAARARNEYAAVLPALERTLGPEHPGTLSTRANLAQRIGEAGDAARARDEYAAVLPALERTLGPEHPGTLSTRANLAHWTGKAGDATGARDQYAALVPMYEKAYGLDHPDTSSIRANPVNWARLTGDPAAAREQHRELPLELQQVQGSEHPAILGVRDNLANMTGLTGDPAGARDQYTALVPIYEKTYGPDHLDTLEARGSLAYWTGEAGDATGARDQYTALVPIYEKTYGPDHPDTLAIRANLANWAGLAGDPTMARDQHRELLPALQRVQGSEHPATLAVRANLANMTGLAGDPVGARDLYAALLPVIERTQGSDHPAAQSARSNLTHWTRKARESGPASGGRSSGGRSSGGRSSGGRSSGGRSSGGRSSGSRAAGSRGRR